MDHLWELKNGPVPKGMILRHKCDNNHCINIEHAELGTQRDNVLDTFIRGRSHTKLKPKDVRQIRRSSLSTSFLAKKFGVVDSTISNIKSRRTWAFL
jgi:DNA-binding transcriptional regulator YiaG